MSPLSRIWEQPTLADQYGIQPSVDSQCGRPRKPMEYPISLFMDMTWNRVNTMRQHSRPYHRVLYRTVWRRSYAEEAARILNLYSKYNGRCTAEMLDATTL